MSLGKFTTANAAALQANGRVNNRRKLPLALSIENDCVLRVTNTDGFRLAVRIADALRSSDDLTLLSEHVECILPDGTALLCEGSFDPDSGRIRLDAVDQTNFYWFWLEVGENFLG